MSPSPPVAHRTREHRWPRNRPFQQPPAELQRRRRLDTGMQLPDQAGEIHRTTSGKLHGEMSRPPFKRRRIRVNHVRTRGFPHGGHQVGLQSGLLRWLFSDPSDAHHVASPDGALFGGVTILRTPDLDLRPSRVGACSAGASIAALAGRPFFGRLRRGGA